jgi:geranylgeranyl transferase type-2 subunit beta
MDETTYLTRLTLRLFEGIKRLPAEQRQRHAEYLRGQQNDDGGFSGREGDSDLYYTAFGLRGLMILDALTPDICTSAAGFLRRSLTQQASVVDFFSLLYAWMLVQLGGGPDVFADTPSDWPARVAALLESFRTADGGYAKTPGGAAGSTYYTFMVALCYEILGKDVPDPTGIAQFVRGRQREDGGFVEIAAMKRSGTNPTTAAVGLLQMLPGVSLSVDESERVIAFLTDMPSFEGGIRANGRAPLADLLSTFTAAWTLDRLGAAYRLDRESIQSFIEGVEQPDGGFRGGLWDEGCDVEYTFYGLAALALLA